MTVSAIVRSLAPYVRGDGGRRWLIPGFAGSRGWPAHILLSVTPARAINFDNQHGIRLRTCAYAACLPQVSRLFELAEHDSHMCVLDIVLLLEVVGDDRAKVGTGGLGWVAVWPGWVSGFCLQPVACNNSDSCPPPHTRPPSPAFRSSCTQSTR